MAQLHLRRLKAELSDFQSGNVAAGIFIEDISDLQNWRIKLVGAPGTLYEGEEYILRFRFGDDYPMEAPEVKIVKLIIDKQVVFMEKSPVNEHVYSNGHICLSILYDQWSPALTVSAICLSIQSMLSSSKVKSLPPDNEHYVRNCRGSPKKTLWAYHVVMQVTGVLRAAFKRAQRGLYAGETIHFGDTKSEMGNRNRRSWKPNAQRVSLWSETLQRRVRLTATTTALGLIDKAGGLDAYILAQRLPESNFAAELKASILKSKLQREQDSQRQIAYYKREEKTFLFNAA